jgi:hypothetical protein
MADATVTLGLNASEFKSGLQRASAEVDNFSKKAAKTGGGRGAGISMQLQDIAVQAQMGTSALTIFSQQAPQILSVFGNFGALAGGFAAVGGAAYTFGQQSSEAFRTVLKDAAALNSEIGRLAGSGATLESSLDAFTRIKDAQKAMSGESQSRQDGGGFGQMSQELLAVFGLAESNYDQSKEAEIATVALKKQQIRLQNEIVKASGNEVMLAQLKAAGDDKAVDALDRKLKLEAQIRKIKSYGLETGAESKLIENATAISELQGKQKTKTFDIAKNIQEQANAANSILAPYQQFLNFLDEAKRKQDGINQANKEARKNAQSQIESQKNAAQSLEDEIRMIDARASGDDKRIKAAERELAIKEKSRQIQQQLGLTADKATAIATTIQDAKEKADAKESGGGGDGGRKKIMGYSWERQGGRDEARGRAATRRQESDAKRSEAYKRGFGGLDDFYADQKDPNFAKPKTPMLDSSKLKPVESSVKSTATSDAGRQIEKLYNLIEQRLTVD